MDMKEAIATALADAAGDTTNLVPAEDETTEVESEATETVEVEGDEGEGDPSEEDDESPSEEEAKPEVYEVKVNGETVEVTLDEALAGYMRQADYTRKTQGLPKPEEIETLAERAKVSDVIDERFSTDPVGLLGDFFTNAGKDPSALFLEVTKELIGLGALNKELLDFFQVTPEAQQALAKGVQDRRGATARELELRQREQRLAPVEKQEEESKYVEQVDAQFAEFVESKGVDEEERIALRNETLRYMAENEMYELADVKRAARIVHKERELAKKEAELAKPARKSTPVARPSRRSSAVPAAQPKDLRSTIERNLFATVPQGQ